MSGRTPPTRLTPRVVLDAWRNVTPDNLVPRSCSGAC